jgi:hypothetical protein
MNRKNIKIIKYVSLCIATALLIWQTLDIYTELKMFPVYLGDHRRYLIATIILSVLLYLITNHTEMIIQHIASALNVLLAIYNWAILGLGYKIAPWYIKTITDETTIFIETEIGAANSMKAILITILILFIAIFTWYIIVVYHNKVEKENN